MPALTSFIGKQMSFKNLPEKSFMVRSRVNLIKENKSTITEIQISEKETSEVIDVIIGADNIVFTDTETNVEWEKLITT